VDLELHPQNDSGKDRLASSCKPCREPILDRRAWQNLLRHGILAV
jgi:hypothetical protein